MFPLYKAYIECKESFDVLFKVAVATWATNHEGNFFNYLNVGLNEEDTVVKQFVKTQFSIFLINLVAAYQSHRLYLIYVDKRYIYGTFSHEWIVITERLMRLKSFLKFF